MVFGADEREIQFDVLLPPKWEESINSVIWCYMFIVSYHPFYLQYKYRHSGHRYNKLNSPFFEKAQEWFVCEYPGTLRAAVKAWKRKKKLISFSFLPVFEWACNYEYQP